MSQPAPGPADAPRTLLGPDHPHWPTLWRQMPDPPGEIHASGNTSCLAAPAVAIVGTRRATVRGTSFARALAAALANHGYTIVSGLALGVDAAAHHGALDVEGHSVAVMGTGLDITYPRAHAGLRRELEEKGCCLTEFPPGTPPRRFHFPLRNRLMAGLVRAVVVVEAPRRSGALVTAYAALDYNREVFAVPGPVDLQSSRGCHHLLREGAHLVESADDVLRVLGDGDPAPRENGRAAGSGPSGRSLPRPGTPARWIFDRLDFDGCTVEELFSRWPGRRETWSAGLLQLELAGQIKRLPGGILARSIW